MATIGFQLAYGDPHIVHLPEHTTSSSFTPGDLVAVVSGYIQCIATGTHTSTIFGVAQKKYKGTLGTSTPVHVISSGDVFIAQMNTTSTTTHIGPDYGVNTAVGSQSVNATSTGCVVVIDFFEPVNTATGKVLVKFIPGVLQSEEVT